MIKKNNKKEEEEGRTTNKEWSITNSIFLHNINNRKELKLEIYEEKCNIELENSKVRKCMLYPFKSDKAFFFWGR